MSTKKKDYFDTKEFKKKKEFNRTHCNRCKINLPEEYIEMTLVEAKKKLKHTGFKHFCPRCQPIKKRQMSKLASEFLYDRKCTLH